jgi:hypothetical protein
MRHHDLTANSKRAARAGRALVVGVMPQVEMLRNPGAMIRASSVSD